MDRTGPAEIDKRAVRTLFHTFRSNAGPHREALASIPPAEFEHAKRAGVMFEPARVSHDSVVNRAIKAVRAIDREAVADAFVVSLTSHRMDMRSALGSYACMLFFPPHSAIPGEGICPVCGLYQPAGEHEQEVDLNVLNFERLKWGGVRHDQALYTAMDLELFAQLPRVRPTKTEIATFRAVLAAIDDAPDNATSANLDNHLKDLFKSTKAEREQVIAILGYCGLFAVKEHPGYGTRFAPSPAQWQAASKSLDLPTVSRRFLWAKRINATALAFWFGHLQLS